MKALNKKLFSVSLIVFITIVSVVGYLAFNQPQQTVNLIPDTLQPIKSSNSTVEPTPTEQPNNEHPNETEIEPPVPPVPVPVPIFVLSTDINQPTNSCVITITITNHLNEKDLVFWKEQSDIEWNTFSLPDIIPKPPRTVATSRSFTIHILPNHVEIKQNTTYIFVLQAVDDTGRLSLKSEEQSITTPIIEL